MFAKLNANQATRVGARQRRKDEELDDKDPTQNAEAFWRAFTPQLDRTCVTTLPAPMPVFIAAYLSHGTIVAAVFVAHKAHGGDF